MKRLSPIQWILAACFFLTVLSVPPVRAFSLLGPLESWMTATNGFALPTDYNAELDGGATPLDNPTLITEINGPVFLGEPALIGGPMLLGNGYRWNVPVVTYGFDQSFINYFGTNGVAAVTSAINLLNTLPPASQLVPANYPLDSQDINYAATSLTLADLKSTTLFLLLEHLGLAAPDQYAFNIRELTINNGVVDAVVVQRNYDPVTHQPSAYVNGNLLAYDPVYFIQNGTAHGGLDIYPVSSSGLPDSTVADGLLSLGFGHFYSGLTADDVGGLAYLYSPNNINFEFLPPGVHAAGGGPLVNGALRRGVDKITFVPQPVDPVTGGFSPAANEFTDTYVTNSQTIQQLLVRVTTQPDFIFSATDLVTTTAWFDRTGTTNWVNNAAWNGQPSGPGPGVIQSPVHIVFNKFGTVWESVATFSEDAPSENLPASLVRWGIFDGSTNAPVSFPTSSNRTNATPVRLTLMLNQQAVNYHWQITDTVNTNYWLETSTNLSGPGPVNWQPLFVVPINGSVSSYINENPVSARRFYQLVPDPLPWEGSLPP